MGQVAELHDPAYVRRTVDTEIAEALKRCGFHEERWWQRVKILLGLLATAAGTASYAVPGALSEVYWSTLLLVLLYCLLHGSLQLLMLLVERDFVVRARAPRDPAELVNPEWAVHLRHIGIATRMQRFSTSLHVRAESPSAAASDDVDISSCLHADGAACAGKVDKVVRGLLDELCAMDTVDSQHKANASATRVTHGKSKKAR